MPKSANPESTPKRWSQPFSLNVPAYAHKTKCCTLRSPRPPTPSEAHFLKYLARLAPKDPRVILGLYRGLYRGYTGIIKKENRNDRDKREYTGVIQLQ